MDYSSLFVCLMGMGTVFFGLICLILLTVLMGRICAATKQVTPKASEIAAPVAANESNQEELIAAISAAVAEELGTDLTGIRILSFKKI